MFPVTITLNNITELTAVMAALGHATVTQKVYAVIEETKEAAAAPSGKSTKDATASSSRTAAVEKADAPAASASTSSSERASSTTTPPADAPAAPADVAYADLQKAILKLHAKDPSATQAIAKGMGLDNFKPLKEDGQGARRAEALKLIQAKLAELEG